MKSTTTKASEESGAFSFGAFEMDELIPIQLTDIGGEQIQTCNARELHKFLGIGKDFSNWVKAQIERAAFAENVDYIKISGKSLSPKRANASRARSVLNLAKSHMRRGDCRRYERGQLALAAAFRVLAASCFFSALPCANSSVGVISAFNAFAFNSSSHAGIVSAPLPRIF